MDRDSLPQVFNESDNRTKKILLPDSSESLLVFAELLASDKPLTYKEIWNNIWGKDPEKVKAMRIKDSLSQKEIINVSDRKRARGRPEKELSINLEWLVDLIDALGIMDLETDRENAKSAISQLYNTRVLQNRIFNPKSSSLSFLDSNLKQMLETDKHSFHKIKTFYISTISKTPLMLLLFYAGKKDFKQKIENSIPLESKLKELNRDYAITRKIWSGELGIKPVFKKEYLGEADYSFLDDLSLYIEDNFEQVCGEVSSELFPRYLAAHIETFIEYMNEVAKEEENIPQTFHLFMTFNFVEDKKKLISSHISDEYLS